MNAPPFILASASPRRTELLNQLLPQFRVVPSDAEEFHDDQLTARELAQANAHRKARAVAKNFPDALVLGADTLVYLGIRVFGKPGSLAEARRMLQQLQGHTHQVVTGVCLVHWQSGRQKVFAEFTDVRFKVLSSDQIDAYLASIDPLDKAGGYAIQVSGETIVDQVSGSYSNVVGLPLERLREELAEWGIKMKPTERSA
jgi:septum formation protein